MFEDAEKKYIEFACRHKKDLLYIKTTRNLFKFIASSIESLVNAMSIAIKRESLCL